LSTEAATPSGGAETSARPDVSSETPQSSVHDRLKASLFGTPEPEQKPKPKPQVAQAEAAPAKAAADTESDESDEVEAEEAPATKDEPTDDAQTEEEAEAKYESLTELAEALGWDLDKILDLEASTKIDGKEGKARLRDLLKSYQLEGHLNQKLMTHAEERKAFETERQTFVQQQQHKLMQLDAGLKVAQKMLEGEFSQVDWQNLQDTNPLEFNQKYVAFQQRQAQLNQIADQLGQERSRSQQAELQQQQAYLAEQAKLMDSKIPEWADAKVRERDIADMAVILNQTYGVTEEELKNLRDHREILIARDAWRWQKLQKSKPALLNKVKAAPKLLKPGAPQSRAAQEGLMLKQERDRLRKSGKVSDAKAPLKRLLFNS
jgi:hypothetical protein